MAGATSCWKATDSPPAAAAAEAQPESDAAEAADSPASENPEEEASTESTTPPRISFPTFGAEFNIPAGWSSEPTLPQAGFLARWLPDEATDDEWAQFTVEVRPVAGEQTAGQAAAAFEQRGYQRSSAWLGGGAVIRLDFPRAEGGERKPIPSPVFITRRGERLWRLLFLLDDPAQESVVEAVTGDWRWLPIAPVVDHLELGEPQSVFSGLGTIRVPAIARVDADLTTENSTAFTAYDYREVQDAIVIYLERFAAAESDSLDAQAILYAEQVERRTEIGKVIEFDPVGNLRNIRASEVIRGDFNVDGETVSRYSAYAVWQPTPTDFIRMQAVVNDEAFDGDAELARAIQTVGETFSSVSGIRSPPPSE